MTQRRTQGERSGATRRALLSAARALFGEGGFARTGRDQIAERAGVTRGALYHHFGSKELLFRAVVEDLEREIVDKVATVAARGSGPAERLQIGALAFLDASMERDFRRIVLLDAPSVLGWEEWRAIDAQYGLGMVEAALAEAQQAGLLGPQPVGPLAHLLLGALNEAALLVATAARPRAARKEVGATLVGLLDRLLLHG